MEDKNKINIGIVDQPNANFDSDSLNIKPHADALTNFIERCDTPITIGIQGEWGSGKTSLLNLIENNLNGIIRNMNIIKENFYKFGLMHGNILYYPNLKKLF